MSARALGALLSGALVFAAGAGAVTLVGYPNRSGEHLVSVNWRLNPNRPSGGRKVHLLYRYRGYSCQYRFQRATAKETEAAVTVKVRAHWRALRPGEACTAELGGGAATVTLDEPLGDRKLRHANVTDPRYEEVD